MRLGLCEWSEKDLRELMVFLQERYGVFKPNMCSCGEEFKSEEELLTHIRKKNGITEVT
jgi:hypothetical protein